MGDEDVPPFERWLTLFPGWRGGGRWRAGSREPQKDSQGRKITHLTSGGRTSAVVLSIQQKVNAPGKSGGEVGELPPSAAEENTRAVHDQPGDGQPGVETGEWAPGMGEQGACNDGKRRKLGSAARGGKATDCGTRPGSVEGQGRRGASASRGRRGAPRSTSEAGAHTTTRATKRRGGS